VNVHGFNQVTFDIRISRAEYDAILKGTPKNISALL
jgi:hypothetical protein